MPQSEAELTASTTVGEAPLEVSFTNLSTNAHTVTWGNTSGPSRTTKKPSASTRSLSWHHSV